MYQNVQFAFTSTYLEDNASVIRSLSHFWHQGENLLSDGVSVVIGCWHSIRASNHVFLLTVRYPQQTSKKMNARRYAADELCADEKAQMVYHSLKRKSRGKWLIDT